MPIGLSAPEALLPINGIQLSAVSAGIRNSASADLVLIELASNSRVAAVFTQNQFCAAPVMLAKEHLQAIAPRYLLVNAGNANAGTGAQGLLNARESCRLIGVQGGVAEQSVLPFSTGVIGQQLPLDKIKQALPQAFAALESNAWLDAAQGIMTTDTLPKGLSTQIKTANGVATMTGIAKGAGMICPNMATMLGFIATDANIDQTALDSLHQRLVQQSFNRISVDGDTSTNDACVLIATATGPELDIKSNDWPALEQAALALYQYLAQAIIRDGEGVTKFTAVNVVGGKSEADCEMIARAVAHSPLVKTALFASDANWGRILAAVGRAGVPLSIEKISLAINGVQILENGEPHPAYTEDAGAAAIAEADLEILIDLGLGNAEYTLWTTDLSHEYVTINAEYRT